MTPTDLVEEAYKKKKIGMRQYKAMLRHAGHHSSEHIRRMLQSMQHTTFREAHKLAMKEVGS